MKIKPKYLTPRFSRFGPAIAALLLGITITSAPAQVLPPNSHPYGHSYAEWSAKWWQWSLEQSASHLEVVGKPRDIGGDDGKQVRFLLGAYLTGGVVTETNQVTIPDSTPLFFSVLSAWADNSGCPDFTSFKAGELEDQVKGNWGAVTLTSCTIDGKAVSGLSDPATTDYLFLSPAFGYTTAENDNILAVLFGDTCIDGGTRIYPAVADGVYIMLAPLKPGKHTIHTVGIVGPIPAPYVELDLTYEITVTRDCDHDGHRD
jgi:hypothetical protein